MDQPNGNDQAKLVSRDNFGAEFGKRIGQKAYDWYQANVAREIDEAKKQQWAQQMEMAKSSSDPKFGEEIGQKFHDWWAANNIDQTGDQTNVAREIDGTKMQ